MRCAFAFAALLLAACPAAAEESLVAGVSQDVVQISSTYTGTDLTVFGAIEQPSEGGVGDIVVVVRGPDAMTTVRRKDRIAGVWINNARARLLMPSYYFVASTRRLDSVAGRDVLGRYGLGLSNLRPDSAVSDGDPAPFENALIRAQARARLYAQNTTGVEMLSNTLFRVKVPIPAGVPRGPYNVQVYLFRDGTVVSAQSTPLYVDQTGFERGLYDFSRDRPFTYGLVTVLLGIAMGWMSTFFFRRGA
ncbi:MAG: TIGR02186 family protein [Alphaproteobacteria bacterium]|nr:TIGR02186 family protein [Alphaproteobacteria bacterium]